jgi:hypothetical protein
MKKEKKWLHSAHSEKTENHLAKADKGKEMRN